MFRKKETAPDPVREHAVSRLQGLSDIEILGWADQAGSGIAKALDDFRRLRDHDALIDAQSGVSALAGALDVLINRVR